jgi:Xaa-Pro aminopeptidase
MIGALDVDNVRRARPDAEIITPDSLGSDELLAAGRNHDELDRELVLRACRELGITSARVPLAFPLHVADHVRPGGVELVPDRELFAGRRRAKSEAELAGIRRAQQAAEAGMRTASTMLAEAEPGGDGMLVLDGEPLTCERVQAAIDAEFTARDATVDAIMVAPGAQGALGHELGNGPIATGTPVIVDLWPQDRSSTCFADMTRTFVAGTPDEEIVAWHALCREALARCTEMLRPGVRGRDVWGAACDVFEAAGHPTQRTKTPGETLRDGFFHALAHGIGLEVHEAPMVGRGPDSLVAGDVIAIEPGLYRHGYGGVRLEDVVRVTDDGPVVVTDFPYELTPGL